MCADRQRHGRSRRPCAPADAWADPDLRQRGVAAIFAAVSLVTLLAAVALGIDIGRLYFADRDLQRLADLAAIDGARVHSQCLGAASLAGVEAEVAESLRRNGLPAGTTPIARLGTRASGVDGLWRFVPAAPGTVGDSVQVTLSRATPARILPLFGREEARTLTARAAAHAEWTATAAVGPPLAASGAADFRPAFFGAALGTTLGFGGGGFGSSLDVEVSVSDLVNIDQEINTPLPGGEEVTDAFGLLTGLERLLDSTGDAAAATAVSAFADAVAAGRPGAGVVPAEVLGIPAQGPYDGATVAASDVLNGVAAALSEGQPVELSNLCEQLPIDLRQLPAIVPPLCDSSASIRLPDGSRPGIANASTPVLDVSNETQDSATTATALVEVRLALTNPLTGERLALPLRVAASPATAKVTALDCARLGQPRNLATVRAQGPRVQVGLGDSDTFTQRFSTGDANVAGALDDLAPAPVLRATVGEILGQAGLGAVVANPLFAGFLGQEVTVSVRLALPTIGDDRPETFCMTGPPFSTPVQCNGAPARVGGEDAQAVGQRLADALREVELSVQLPQGLPPALGAALNGAVTPLTEALNAQLGPAFQLLGAQLVPVLTAANIAVGESEVVLRGIQVLPPAVYAR
jgi:uncharacterized membrane protein